MIGLCIFNQQPFPAGGSRNSATPPMREFPTIGNTWSLGAIFYSQITIIIKMNLKLLTFIVLLNGFSVLNVFTSFAQSKENITLDSKSIQKSFMTWWNYTYQNIHFSENFVPLDTFSNIITKKQFLKLLTSGNFIPIKIENNTDISKYKLSSIYLFAENDIRKTIIQIGKDALEKYKMEGTEFPEFKFTDLNGNTYTKENIKGKILVLKCWFIHCQQCIAEMPVLNDLTKKYRNRKDIIFLSLAYDSKEKLKTFLLQTKFNYAVIPTEQDYMEGKLKVSAYPTHFIINKNGLIAKVTTNAHEMINALEIEVSK